MSLLKTQEHEAMHRFMRSFQGQTSNICTSPPSLKHGRQERLHWDGTDGKPSNGSLHTPRECWWQNLAWLAAHQEGGQALQRREDVWFPTHKIYDFEWLISSDRDLFSKNFSLKCTLILIYYFRLIYTGGKKKWHQMLQLLWGEFYVIIRFQSHALGVIFHLEIWAWLFRQTPSSSQDSSSSPPVLSRMIWKHAEIFFFFLGKVCKTTSTHLK